MSYWLLANHLFFRPVHSIASFFLAVKCSCIAICRWHHSVVRILLCCWCRRTHSFDGRTLSHRRRGRWSRRESVATDMTSGQQHSSILVAVGRLQQTAHGLQRSVHVIPRRTDNTSHYGKRWMWVFEAKNKLRSTTLQDRLESLMLASVEKDLLLPLSNDDLVPKFAAAADHRLDLG